MGDNGKLSLKNIEHNEQTRAIIEGIIKHTTTTKEVSSTIMRAICVPFTDKSANIRVCHLLVLDVNGLLC